jgi:hypothetical protein
LIRKTEEVFVRKIIFAVVGLALSPFVVIPPAQAQSAGTAYVYTETASLWKEPGYSWKNCSQLQRANKFKNFDQLLKTSEACSNHNRRYLQSGDPVSVMIENRKFKSVEKTLSIDGEQQKMKFYYVEATVKDENGKMVRMKGWMSADQLTPPQAETPEVAIDSEPAKPSCLPRAKDSLKDLQKNAKGIEGQLRQETALGKIKSDREIDHFMCIYRRKLVSDKQFEKMLPEFRQAALKAETVFHIPYAVTMCTMLIESGLYYNASEGDEYRGLGQFGSAAIEDLNKLMKDSKKPYGKMWNKYTDARLTNRAVRQSNNPEVATGAVALMLQWLYQDRLPAAGCRECSHNGELNKRDLHLMVAGYNYSPYALTKIANRSLAQMQSSFPPPRETRNYMTQMDRCLEKGQDKKFRVGRNDKHEEISHEYKDRHLSCDKNHPY